MSVSEKPSIAMAAKPQLPLVTYKKLVTEMMQGIDMRMGHTPKAVSASAA